jgi:preprotein translocase subunit SecB
MIEFPLTASPLHLEHYFLQALRFETKENFDRDQMALTPAPEDLKWNLENGNVKDGIFAFRLTLQLPPENERFAYAFEIILTGIFKVDDKYKGDAEKIADANGPAVLFGAAREIIATVSGRGHFPALSLPTVHFQDLVREPIKKAKSNPKTKPSDKKSKALKGKSSKRQPVSS